MSKDTISDSEDDNFGSSTFQRTQTFTKSGTYGGKHLSSTQSKMKFSKETDFKYPLDKSDDDDDDGDVNVSDDEQQNSTARSLSGGTTSQSTPKPKERSFSRKETERPEAKPRHADRRVTHDNDDDDPRGIFNKNKDESSPRYNILSLHEEKERDESFVRDLGSSRRPQSPADIFSAKPNAKHHAQRPSVRDERRESDSDSERLLNKHSKHNEFSRGRQDSNSATQPRKLNDTSKSKSDLSDDENGRSPRQFQVTDYKHERKPSNELLADRSNTNQEQLPSNHAISTNRKDFEPDRRSSFCDDRGVLPSSEVNEPIEPRPNSAKTGTTRQQTQSAIDSVTAANVPHDINPLTSHNEALSTSLQHSPPPTVPRSSASLPPKPTSNQIKATPRMGKTKRQTFKVPSRYQEVTSKIDSGRQPASDIDLKRSVARALDKEMQKSLAARPQSARARKLSTSSELNASERRRSLSAYEHVRPRISTNRSIDFDQLDTTQFRNDTSQSIKDSAYFEWLKNKEDRKRLEQKQLKRLKEEKSRLIDQSVTERKIQQNAQQLYQWRQEKEKAFIQKRREEIRLQREEEAKKQQAKDKKDAKLGFDEWKKKKEGKLEQEIEVRQDKKNEIEQRQDEKQRRLLEAGKVYEKWKEKKDEQVKKIKKTSKQNQEDQLERMRKTKEEKFVNAQHAYEKWLEEKEKNEIEEKIHTMRRNSLTIGQPQVPFLPGGSQKNTGKIRHVAW